jgi:hypothetical protein
MKKTHYTILLFILILAGCRHKDGDDHWNKVYGSWKSTEVIVNDTIDPELATAYNLVLSDSRSYRHDFPAEHGMTADSGAWSMSEEVSYLYFVPANTAEWGRYNFVILQSEEGTLWIRRQLDVLHSLEIHFNLVSK